MHRLGVAHLDIKGDNVMVAFYPEGPRVWYIDFGTSVACGKTIVGADIFRPPS